MRRACRHRCQLAALYGTMDMISLPSFTSWPALLFTKCLLTHAGLEVVPLWSHKGSPSQFFPWNRLLSFFTEKPMHLSDFVLDCLCLSVGHDYHSGIRERSMQAVATLTDNINRYRSEVAEHAGEQLVVCLTVCVYSFLKYTSVWITDYCNSNQQEQQLELPDMNIRAQIKQQSAFSSLAFHS